MRLRIRGPMGVGRAGCMLDAMRTVVGCCWWVGRNVSGDVSVCGDTRFRWGVGGGGWLLVSKGELIWGWD
jgi:hypothetical protein